MPAYKRLDLSSLVYSNEKITYEEATRGKISPVFDECVPAEKAICDVSAAEKDYDSKCVGLVIS